MNSFYTIVVFLSYDLNFSLPLYCFVSLTPLFLCLHASLCAEREIRRGYNINNFFYYFRRSVSFLVFIYLHFSVSSYLLTLTSPSLCVFFVLLSLFLPLCWKRDQAGIVYLSFFFSSPVSPVCIHLFHCVCLVSSSFYFPFLSLSFRFSKVCIHLCLIISTTYFPRFFSLLMSSPFLHDKSETRDKNTRASCVFICMFVSVNIHPPVCLYLRVYLTTFISRFLVFFSPPLCSLFPPIFCYAPSSLSALFSCTIIFLFFSLFFCYKYHCHTSLHYQGVILSHFIRFFSSLVFFNAPTRVLVFISSRTLMSFFSLALLFLSFASVLFFSSVFLWPNFSLFPRLSSPRPSPSLCSPFFLSRVFPLSFLRLPFSSLLPTSSSSLLLLTVVALLFFPSSPSFIPSISSPPLSPPSPVSLPFVLLSTFPPPYPLPPSLLPPSPPLWRFPLWSRKD